MSIRDKSFDKKILFFPLLSTGLHSKRSSNPIPMKPVEQKLLIQSVKILKIVKRVIFFRRKMCVLNQTSKKGLAAVTGNTKWVLAYATEETANVGYAFII